LLALVDNIHFFGQKRRFWSKKQSFAQKSIVLPKKHCFGQMFYLGKSFCVKVLVQKRFDQNKKIWPNLHLFGQIFMFWANLSFGQIFCVTHLAKRSPTQMNLTVTWQRQKDQSRTASLYLDLDISGLGWWLAAQALGFILGVCTLTSFTVLLA